MTRRRVHPTVIALGAVAVLPLLVAAELYNASRRTMTMGFSWQGEPSDEQVMAMAMNQLSWTLGPILAATSAAAALGLVLFWCLAPRQRGTRTMSDAGSTRNRAATTVPNSSPSISNSSGAASISMSTARPRE